MPKLRKNNFEIILNSIYKKLKNKNILNKRSIITFSGVPGSGKTTISKKSRKNLKM